MKTKIGQKKNSASDYADLQRAIDTGRLKFLRRRNSASQCMAGFDKEVVAPLEKSGKMGSRRKKVQAETVNAETPK